MTSVQAREEYLERAEKLDKDGEEEGGEEGLM